jgi:hypothetical protein
VTRDSKESVLSRWSRRKLEADQATAAIEESIPLDAQTDQSVPAVQEDDAVEKPVLTDADMPDVESLTEDSDFSGFMSSGVSDELRNLALRKLFKAPVFNIRDGLDEYDEDYTYFEKLGDIVTCDMKHHIEMKEQKLREAQAEAEAAEADEIEEMVEDDMEAIEAEAETEVEVETEETLDEQAETVAAAEAEPEPRLKKEAGDE